MFARHTDSISWSLGDMSDFYRPRGWSNLSHQGCFRERRLGCGLSVLYLASMMLELGLLVAGPVGLHLMLYISAMRLKVVDTRVLLHTPDLRDATGTR